MIGMTDEERANHRPGTGFRIFDDAGNWRQHLNRTRSLADVYEVEKIGTGNGRFHHRWTPKKDGGR